MPVRVREFEQTLRGERLDRLADHRAARAELAAEVGLVGKRVARPEIAADDAAAEILDHVGEEVSLPAGAEQRRGTEREHRAASVEGRAGNRTPARDYYQTKPPALIGFSLPRSPGRLSGQPSADAASGTADRPPARNSISIADSSAIRASAGRARDDEADAGDAAAGMVEHRGGDAGRVVVDQAGDGADAGLARRLRLGEELLAGRRSCRSAGGNPRAG